MSIGIKKQIETIVEELGADIRSRMHKDLSVLHCAAQTYPGYLSIFMLCKKYKMNANIKDSFNATPLHFAIIHKEFKNVEALITCGADVNA